MKTVCVVCPYCGDDDYSLVKKVDGGVLALCCTCGEYFEIADEDEGAAHGNNAKG